MITTRTGKVAVVTGAASGIGRELAYGLGRRGCRLAISDVDETGLAVTASTLRSSGVEVHAVRLDVADRAAVAGYASEVAEHFGVVHQLYNNAGVGLARHVTEMSYADFDRVLQINLWGVVHGTKEFLPHLIASGDGHLVNISSINGFLAQPGLVRLLRLEVRGPRVHRDGPGRDDRRPASGAGHGRPPRRCRDQHRHRFSRALPGDGIPGDGRRPAEHRLLQPEAAPGQCGVGRGEHPHSGWPAVAPG